MTPVASPISTISSIAAQPLASEELQKMNAYWRAANYLSVGQIYLYANPLLREPLTLGHVKPRLLGHWGTTPGLNFIYVHLNRIINKYDLNVIYVCGPGHGGPGMVANTYLEGTYTELYTDIQQNQEGLQYQTPRSVCIPKGCDEGRTALRSEPTSSGGHRTGRVGRHGTSFTGRSRR